MTRKKAVITIELANESLATLNKAIAQDLLEWFQDEAMPALWV